MQMPNTHATTHANTKMQEYTNTNASANVATNENANMQHAKMQKHNTTIYKLNTMRMQSHTAQCTI
jgi:hypothetical protein